MQKQYRLTKDAEFKQVRGQGRSWAHPLVVLYALPSDRGVTRIGISVSKRIGNAVKRNRTKRLIREAVRLRHLEIKPGWDLLFIARKPIAEASFQQVGVAVEQLLRRARLLGRESESSSIPAGHDRMGAGAPEPAAGQGHVAHVAEEAQRTDSKEIGIGNHEGRST